MKSLLTINLSENFEIIAVKGQKIKAGEVIARKIGTQLKEKIPLSKILSVPSSKITAYLEKKLGCEVKKGEMLARKSGVFKTIRILSPVNGVLDSIDLKEGFLFLTTKSEDLFEEKAPVNGMIESCVEGEITISFDGKVIEGEKGKGERAIGSTLLFTKHVDMTDFAYEVDERIIIGRTFTEGARAKLKALGASGMVSLEYYDDFPVIVTLSEKQLKDISANYQHNLILLGDKRRIVIPA